MPTPPLYAPRNPQTGAVTIMVALMLLVLLTIAAVGMSRNSFREIVNSAFSRQGAMADNVAESGLDWAVYWMDGGNTPTTTANPSAVNLLALKNTLLMDNTLAGLPRTITDNSTGTKIYTPGNDAPGTDMSWTSLTKSGISISEGYTVGLTLMGKLPVTNESQGAGTGAFTPATGTVNLAAPDLWAVRADAQVVQGKVTFIHGKEAWISTPVQQ